MIEQKTRDPRVSPLPTPQVFMNTQFRVTFCPVDPAGRALAFYKQIGKQRMDQMQLGCSRGKVHVQIKNGLAEERHAELTLPEALLLREALDRFISELPLASISPAADDSEEDATA